MKPAKLAVLGVSLAVMAGAMWFSQRPQAPIVVQANAPQAPAIQTEEVLVIKVDAAMGMVIKAEDIGWDVWPSGSVQPNLITRANAGPEGEKEIIGSMVRYQLFAGEPVRREKLIRTDGTGFMSAILPSGMRAVSIGVEGSGSDVAGGFILPNDRVDILRTFTDASGANTTETLLRNIRVLAIGQQVKEEDGKTTIIAGNATLELDPKQVETITLAQRTSKLSLALRALVDHNKPEVKTEATADSSLTIIRMGVQQKIGGSN
jgi:pilus assembly protein CpaB